MVRSTQTLARKARQRRFHAMVAKAVKDLPVDVQRLLDNVAIVVEDEPTAAHLEDSDAGNGNELFGLYQGIPRTERDSSYSLVIPDRITIFTGPLERAYAARRDLEEQVRITVLHELGHHLGYDEDGLDTLGLS